MVQAISGGECAASVVLTKHADAFSKTHVCTKLLANDHFPLHLSRKSFANFGCEGLFPTSGATTMPAAINQGKGLPLARPDQKEKCKP
jgi:hypothetical protein